MNQLRVRCHTGGRDGAPLVAHVVFRMDVGGLENGLVNLVNHMPADRYRHCIICLTTHTRFRERISRDDVPLVALDKKSGKDLGAYVRLWKTVRALRPDIVHTRNIGTLDCQVPCSIAGVSRRVHGEHGRDISDVDGSNRKYLRRRRQLQGLVHRFVPMSRDLALWLNGCVGIDKRKIVQIYNGVDERRFRPPAGSREPLPLPGFAGAGQFVIGAVGRMDPVKDPLNLVRAFLALLERCRDYREKLRLVYIGDGPLLDTARRLLAEAGAENLAWLPGARDDIPALLRGFDLFVLPSLAEGISNTILEAMSSRLPVLATDVGGNRELVTENETGRLVRAGAPAGLAEVVEAYLQDTDTLRRHGVAGRARVERDFSLESMVRRYLHLYDDLIEQIPLRH